jgi:cyclopropane-fatty-acyl-phospholipid synthase
MEHWEAADLPAEVAPPRERPRRTLKRARVVLEQLFGSAEGRSFAVRFWDDSVDQPGHTEPRVTLVLRSPWALRRMFLPPSELRLGEAFARGDFDIEGDLEAAAALASLVRAVVSRPAALSRLLFRLVALPADPPSSRPRRRSRGIARLAPTHSRARDRAAVGSHYDLGNDFYALWLDQRMIYSCAYFVSGTEDLEAAQAAKLEHLCRKLRLKPGDRLLDIGCGWGGLVRYAAEHFDVHALGVTLSRAQAALANDRIIAEGLAGRCSVEVGDYRDLCERRPFDRIVSVGMSEHVGRDRLPEYFAKVNRLLKPGGLFLNHGIVAATGYRQAGVRPAVARRMWREGDFINRYVFPDGELFPLAGAVDTAQRAGFETRDVESLREHYVLTLRRWLDRLEAAESDAIPLVGAETYRVWRLYLAASAHAFASGQLGVAQVLFAKAGPAGSVPLPLTRADLYQPELASDPRLLRVLLERMRGGGASQSPKGPFFPDDARED